MSQTRLAAPPLVPEIALYLADACLPIWRASEELARANVEPPFWAFAWAGGQALARYLLDHPDAVRGNRVLDLGAGSGLVAVAAMQAGASGALAADIDPFAVAAISLNAAANGVRLSATDADLLERPIEGIGVLLIGDLFYERQLAGRVFARAREAAARGVSVLAGDPERTYFPRERFERIAGYRVPVSRDLEDAGVKTTGVYRLKHPCQH
jgi:predicted nicotinamide N-methyase